MLVIMLGVCFYFNDIVHFFKMKSETLSFSYIGEVRLNGKESTSADIIVADNKKINGPWEISKPYASFDVDKKAFEAYYEISIDFDIESHEGEYTLVSYGAPIEEIKITDIASKEERFYARVKYLDEFSGNIMYFYSINRNDLILEKDSGLMWHYDPIEVDIMSNRVLSEMKKMGMAFTKDSNYSNIKKLKNLEEVFICYETMECIDHFLGLNELASFSLYDCDNITDISPLINLPKLTDLEIGDCDSIEDYSVISRIDNLSSFKLEKTKKIKNLDDISSLENLKYLEISNCKNLEDTSGIANLENLKVLKIIGCNKIEDITAISKLNNLVRLELVDCDGIKDIQPLLKLTNLKIINIKNDIEIYNINKLKQLPNIIRLD